MDLEPGYSFAQLSESEDLDQVAALEAASFSTPWTRETLARDLLNGDVARLYGLRGRDSRILAFCACWIIADELHINTLAVAEPVRRRGLATALLRGVLTEAAGGGVRRATLEVRRSNEAALRLYAAQGFVIRGVRPNYYSKPEEDGLILWRDHLDVFAGRPRS